MLFTMSLLSCFCLRSSPSRQDEDVPPPHHSPQRETVQANPEANPEANHDNESAGSGSGFREGYASVAPLPPYTTRPLNASEKTLEAHMRDPPVSSSGYARDEKNMELEPFPNAPEEVTSDTSSAISFPSSYGNTSTATRETPPPPYSPGPSPPVSRRMSISDPTTIEMPRRAHISGPGPRFSPYPPELWYVRASRRSTTSDA